MTDIHCHILPKIDDGASSAEEAVRMAGMAYESGVTAIAATPHFYGAPDSLELLPLITEKLKLFRSALSDEGIPLLVYGGAEILCVRETVELAKRKALPTLGAGKYVLCEFYFDESALTMEAILDSFMGEGYIPVVAHPERYEAIQADPLRLGRWFEKGLILQINRGSILGRFGSSSERTAHFLLSRGLAHVIASDAHSSRMRTPHMADVRRFALENLGAEYTSVLLSENPSRILRGRAVVSAEKSNRS